MGVSQGVKQSSILQSRYAHTLTGIFFAASFLKPEQKIVAYEKLYKFVTEWLHMRRDVFQAIADPTRREILNMIACDRLTPGAVAERFDMSRPAISKHIKILHECGLVVIHRQGRERYCEAKLHKLHEVSKWVEQYRGFWTKKLDALGAFLSATAHTKHKRKPPKRSSK